MKVGTVSNRESFLQHISEKLGKGDESKPVQRPTWETSPQYKILKGKTQHELVEVFKIAAEKVNTSVIETSVWELPHVLQQAIGEEKDSSIVTCDDSRFEEYGLMSVLQDYPYHKWDKESGDSNIEVIKNTKIGITFSDYALAESATVVLNTSVNKSRSVSLLPKEFIALIPKSSIVPRLTQVTDRIQENFHETGEIPSSIKFISGPSNSGDIEMDLVVGVHGPVKVTYIILSDC